MARLLIETKVRDYTLWRPAYDAHEPSRVEATLTNGGVYCRPGDRNDMLLLFDVADVDKARAWTVGGGPERRDESGRCIRYADVHIHQLGGPPADVGSTTDGSPNNIGLCMLQEGQSHGFRGWLPLRSGALYSRR